MTESQAEACMGEDTDRSQAWLAGDEEWSKRTLS